MPLHRIYHPAGPNAFSPEEKNALSKKITEVYTDPQRAQLPAFYVVVLFIPIEENFVGGERNDKFVRIHVQHMARHFSTPEEVNKFFASYEKVLAPFIKEKGFDWEVTIEEVDRALWRENGLPPPAPKSKAEGEWRRLNKPVPYADEDNTPTNSSS